MCNLSNVTQIPTQLFVPSISHDTNLIDCSFFPFYCPFLQLFLLHTLLPNLSVVHVFKEHLSLLQLFLLNT